jgi:hypothetical protein
MHGTVCSPSPSLATRRTHADLEANLGDGYLDDLSGVDAEELASIGAFFASKPVESVLHGACAVLLSGPNEG